MPSPPAPKTPLPSISALRTNSPDGNLSLVTRADDGKTTAVTVGGSPGRSTEPPDGQTGGFLYFNVKDTFVKEGVVPDLWVTVEYFDQGTDTFELQYDAKAPTPNPNDPDLDGDGLPDYPDLDGDGFPDEPDPETFIYQRAETLPVTKTDSGTWLTKTFALTNIWFGNRQEAGADFRISDQLDGPEIIRKVTVSKVAPIAAAVPYAQPAPKLDGKLDDPIWATARKFVMDQRWQIVHPGDKSTWDGPEDYSAIAQLAWDKEALYVAFDVTDDIPRENYSEDVSQQWNGDGIELYIGLDQSNKGRREYIKGKDFQVIIGAHPEELRWAIHRGTTGTVFDPEENGFSISDYAGITNTEKGYILEVKIPWGLLPDANDEVNVNVAPKDGSEIGFNYLANDSDRDDGSSAQEMAMSFSGVPSAWQYPSAWSTVTLAPLETVGGGVGNGDLNGDSRVNVQDATLSLRIAVGSLVPSDAQKAAGDVNGDGKWNVQDATLILRKAVGATVNF